MSLLADVKTDASIEDEVDVLGGGGALDTDAYPSTIALAFLQKSNSGALGLTLHLKSGTREIRETLYVTSGDKKGNLNYYVNQQKEKKYLPGFNLANSLALLTVGKELSELDTEEKVVSLWNSEAKAETPTKVQVITELMGKEIITALFKQVVDKNQKGDDGEYHPTGETREVNEIDKFFRAKDKMTTAEIRAGAETPDFHDKWVAKWKGQVRDRTTKAAPGVSSGAIGKAATATNAKPTESIFG